MTYAYYIIYPLDFVNVNIHITYTYMKHSPWCKLVPLRTEVPRFLVYSFDSRHRSWEKDQKKLEDHLPLYLEPPKKNMPFFKMVVVFFFPVFCNIFAR